VHRANIALAATFPVPWSPPPPQVSNTMGEKSTPIRPEGFGAFPTLLLPLVFKEGGGAAPQGSPGDWVRVDNGQVHREVPPPIPCLQQDVRWAASVSGDVHLAVTRDSGLSKDRAEKGLCSKVPIPESRLLTRRGVVAEDVHRLPA